MKPNREDVQRLVAALMTCVSGIERAKRRGLAAQFGLLRVVAGQEGARPSDLGRALGVHLSHVTRQLQSLERLGYVKVRVDEDDARSRRVWLTKSGRTEIDRLTELGLDRFALFVSGWEAGDVRMLAALLERFEASKAEAVRRSPQPGERAARRKEER